MAEFKYKCGMGIGGWLTNYKRFNVLPMDKRLDITVGDMEHFRTYITSWDIDNIKSMGFDHIRLGFDQIVLEEAPYIYREEIFSILEGFALECEKRGLGIVLNLHKAVGNYCDIEEEITLFESTELQNRFIALWLEMEKRFSTNSYVIFELLNEVRDIEPSLWNDLAEKTITEIRKLNKSRVICIGPTCWNNPNALDKLRVFDDENVIYTFHMYDPSEFTHQRGVLHWKHLYYNRKMEYPGDIEKYREFYRLLFNNHNAYLDFDKMDINYLRTLYEPVLNFIDSRISYMRDVITLNKESGVPYCVWNYLSTPNDGNRFSLVDDDTRKILSDKLLCALLGKL